MARRRFLNLLRRPMRVKYTDPMAVQELSKTIYAALDVAMPSRIIVLCVGTDRSTGDALGPLVGKFLKDRKIELCNVGVAGTLDNPVHANNIQDVVAQIERERDRKSLLIAVDACLGKSKSVGDICVALEPIRPGGGVGRDLGEVGDMSITGVVNEGGFMDYFVLANTRLGLVMKMAEVIAESLESAIIKYRQNTAAKEVAAARERG